VLRISKLADYGIVLLLHAEARRLATRPTRRVTSPRRRRCRCRPPPKILKALAKGGVVASHRGKSGGYVLTRAPETISVVEIITAIDGLPALTQCTEAPEKPLRPRVVLPAKVNWQVVHEAVLKALGSLTLADMASPIGRDAARGHLVQLQGLTLRSA